MYRRRKNRFECNENGQYSENSEFNRGYIPSTRDDSIRNVEEAINNGETPIGVVRNFNNGNTDMSGTNYNIGNSNNVNNYFTRVNNFNITDVNYVRNFVQDVNVIHYNREIVNMGTQYTGSRTIIADDSYDNDCDNPCRPRY